MAAKKMDENTKKVIAALNKARSMELQAIHQYMLHHYLLDELDYGKLCAYMKLIAIDEMRHAEKFAERIMELGGDPTCDLAGPVEHNKTVKEVYPLDVKMEQDTVAEYHKLAKICEDAGDIVSAGIFNSVIEQELVHLGYYEETEDHLETLGDAFLAKYAATSKHSGPIKSFVKVMEKEEL